MAFVHEFEPENHEPRQGTGGGSLQKEGSGEEGDEADVDVQGILRNACQFHQEVLQGAPH
jgi:hypothetical protein